MRRFFVLLTCFLVVMLGCDLFSEKEPPAEDDNKEQFGETPEHTKPVEYEPPGEVVATIDPVPEAYPYPVGAKVGDWVKWKRLVEEYDAESEHELAVIGKQDDLLWIEEVASPQGYDEATWRLVSPAGKVLYAYRGKPGTRGERIGVDANLKETGNPLAALLAAKDAGETKQITVGGQALACKKATVEDGHAWISDAVPFLGLVRFRQGEEGEGFVVTLLAHGRDREQGKLTRKFPRAK